MKKIISLTLMAITAFVMTMSVSSCCSNDSSNNPGDDVKVQGISFEQTSVSLAPDSSETIQVTVLPSDATNPQLIWTSSDESVATVDQNGVVKAVAAGTATITATATDGSGAKATCEVTVPGITMPATLSLTPKGTANLNATVVPETLQLTWTSSNESVATVDQNGVVTASDAPGTAIITASTTDGSGVKAVCTVKVELKGSDGTGISFGGMTGGGVSDAEAKPSTVKF